jgi:hypothetical protein
MSKYYQMTPYKIPVYKAFDKIYLIYRLYRKRLYPHLIGANSRNEAIYNLELFLDKKLGKSKRKFLKNESMLECKGWLSSKPRYVQDGYYKSDIELEIERLKLLTEVKVASLFL